MLAVAHLRSARTDFRLSLASEDAVPFGFCSGGFTSTSSLRSGQRGSTEVERRSLFRWLITPSERRRVFIRAAREKPVSILSAQAFRLRRERQWQQLLPPVVVLKRRVAASLADLLAGHGSRENRDGRRTIRRRILTVKTFFQKKFRSDFPLIFILFSTCEKFIHNRFPQVEISSTICGKAHVEKKKSVHEFEREFVNLAQTNHGACARRALLDLRARACRPCPSRSSK